MRVIQTELRRAEPERFSMEGDGILELARVPIGVRQVALGDQRIGMVLPYLHLLDGRRLFEQVDGLSDSAGYPVDPTQVSHGRERAAVFGPQLGLAERQRLLEERGGLLKAAE